MNKMKVSNETSKALELWLEVNKQHNQDELLEIHMYKIFELDESGIAYENNLRPLNDVSIMNMAKILLFGYEKV